MSPVPVGQGVVAVGQDLGAAADDVPDPDLVHPPGKKPPLLAIAPVEVRRRAEGGVLDARGSQASEVAGQHERPIERAVEVQPPGVGDRVVGGGGVVPGVADVIAVMPATGWLRPAWSAAASSKSATSTPLDASMPRK